MSSSCSRRRVAWTRVASRLFETATLRSLKGGGGRGCGGVEVRTVVALKHEGGVESRPQPVQKGRVGELVVEGLESPNASARSQAGADNSALIQALSLNV